MQRVLVLTAAALLGLASSVASAFVVPATKLAVAPVQLQKRLQHQHQQQKQQQFSSSRAVLTRLMAMKQIGVGVIGAGRIGIVHLEALSSWCVPASLPRMWNDFDDDHV